MLSQSRATAPRARPQRQGMGMVVVPEQNCPRTELETRHAASNASDARHAQEICRRARACCVTRSRRHYRHSRQVGGDEIRRYAATHRPPPEPRTIPTRARSARTPAALLNDARRVRRPPRLLHACARTPPKPQNKPRRRARRSACRPPRECAARARACARGAKCARRSQTPRRRAATRAGGNR